MTFSLFFKKFKISGEFGDVYKGYMKTIDGKCLTVAVKTLKVCFQKVIVQLS